MLNKKYVLIHKMQLKDEKIIKAFSYNKVL